MNVASVYHLIGSCPTPRNLSKILRILLIYKLNVIAQHQTHYGDRCNLLVDARIHEIFCALVLFFHEGTAGTIFDPQITDNEAVPLLIDTGTTS